MPLSEHEQRQLEQIEQALRSGDPYTYSEPLAVAQAIRTWGTGTFAEVYTQATITPQAGGGTFTPPAPPAPSGHRGYADFRNSLGRHLPTQLEQSRRTGLATLHALTHHRRVGR